MNRRKDTMMLPALLLAAALTLPLLGCGDSTPQNSDATAGADAAVGADGTTKADGAGADSKPLGAWTFTPAPPKGGQGGTVDLVAASIDGDKATLELRVANVAQLQGVAFRLRYDAARVSVVKSERGSAWGAQQVIDRFKARDEGELWGGVGFIGARGMNASAQTVLARVELTLSGAKPIAVDFRPAHNVLLSPELRSLPAEWLGGTFSRR